jgi:hypothetical protein
MNDILLAVGIFILTYLAIVSERVDRAAAARLRFESHHHEDGPTVPGRRRLRVD